MIGGRMVDIVKITVLDDGNFCITASVLEHWKLAGAFSPILVSLALRSSGVRAILILMLHD